MIPDPVAYKFYTDCFICFMFFKLYFVQRGRAFESLETPLTISIMACIALDVPAFSSRPKT
jgi:hypothetical protein